MTSKVKLLVASALTTVAVGGALTLASAPAQADTAGERGGVTIQSCSNERICYEI
ncbi:hypothetical protein [Nonomuraea typhae]|uniref:hypothetical protein n=1 Tax=Nonomuraea typhae TaxID=2603600 RepID=UPI0012FBD64E|nr:hypothetical protein [Nonomuraea typhae]